MKTKKNILKTVLFLFLLTTNLIAQEIVDKKVVNNLNLEKPALIYPENGKILDEKEQNSAINFRWTPIVPKPKTPVKYRVVVFDVLKGQSLSKARKSNPVLFENEITDQTQMRLGGPRWVPRDPPVSNKPDFGWYVEVIDIDRKLLARSETGGFHVKNAAGRTGIDFNSTRSNREKGN